MSDQRPDTAQPAISRKSLSACRMPLRFRSIGRCAAVYGRHTAYRTKSGQYSQKCSGKHFADRAAGSCDNHYVPLGVRITVAHGHRQRRRHIAGEKHKDLHALLHRQTVGSGCRADIRARSAAPPRLQLQSPHRSRRTDTLHHRLSVKTLARETAIVYLSGCRPCVFSISGRPAKPFRHGYARRVRKFGHRDDRKVSSCATCKHSLHNVPATLHRGRL